MFHMLTKFVSFYPQAPPRYFVTISFQAICSDVHRMDVILMGFNILVLISIRIAHKLIDTVCCKSRRFPADSVLLS